MVGREPLSCLVGLCKIVTRFRVYFLKFELLLCFPSPICSDTVPKDRVISIESLGLKVIQTEGVNLMKEVERLEKEEGCKFLHPFDDELLFPGYATVIREAKDQGI